MTSSRFDLLPWNTELTMESSLGKEMGVQSTTRERKSVRRRTGSLWVAWTSLAQRSPDVAIGLGHPEAVK